MKHYFLNPLRGCLVAFLLLINLWVIASIILIIYIFIRLFTRGRWLHHCEAWLLKWPNWWMEINYWILQLSMRHKWHVTGSAHLSPNEWYLLICNHRSWMDIFLLGVVFRDKIPLLKFFMKKQLLWSLPIAGWACYVLGYPFMVRHTHKEVRKKPSLKHKDIETTRRACAQFKKFPTTVVNFVEGGRFNLKKHADQQSPYHHLLKPKATGAALVLQELHRELNGILNVTLHYNPSHPSLWSFLTGEVDRIDIHYERLPVTEDLIGDPYSDRAFRRHFQQWLNTVWNAKDKYLQRLNK